LAAGIGWVGHTGGELTYGKDHYKDLNELVQSMMTPAEAVTADQDANDAGSGEDGATENGQGSDTTNDAAEPADLPVDI
jgi:hypothetical protein